ncbi:MAG: collagen-binding domain-containing protein, partial [Limosilactobacillus sp.]
VAIQTQIKFYYDDEKNNSVSPSENHAYPNHVLWNFNDSAAHILIQSGYFMGSILAPNATVTANVNVDGNIVANIVNVKGGESHKWDIHPVEPPSFIEIPTEPTQPTQPTQPSQPTQPDKPVEPEQPTEQPSQPSEQPSQPTQPTQPSQPSQPSQPTQPTQPSTPIKPDKPVEPEQPTNPQPTEPEQPSQPTEQPSQPTNPGEPIVPPTEDDFAGATPDPQPTPQPAPNPEKTPVSPIPASSAAVSAQQPVVTTSKSSVATAAPATSPAAALPQTGNDSHGVLLGIALAIAAQLMIWGLAQPKKKK